MVEIVYFKLRRNFIVGVYVRYLVISTQCGQRASQNMGGLVGPATVGPGPSLPFSRPSRSMSRL